MSACAAVRMFCLECGFRSNACERLKREGRCAKPKVYTADVASRRTVFDMWRRERERERAAKNDSKDDVTTNKSRRGIEKKSGRRNACRDSSDVADGCFEDDWLD